MSDTRLKWKAGFTCPWRAACPSSSDGARCSHCAGLNRSTNAAPTASSPADPSRRLLLFVGRQSAPMRVPHDNVVPQRSRTVTGLRTPRVQSEDTGDRRLDMQNLAHSTTPKKGAPQTGRPTTVKNLAIRRAQSHIPRRPCGRARSRRVCRPTGIAPAPACRSGLSGGSDTAGQTAGRKGSALEHETLEHESGVARELAAQTHRSHRWPRRRSDGDQATPGTGAHRPRCARRGGGPYGDCQAGRPVRSEPPTARRRTTGH